MAFVFIVACAKAFHNISSQVCLDVFWFHMDYEVIFIHVA